MIMIMIMIKIMIMMIIIIVIVIIIVITILLKQMDLEEGRGSQVTYLAAVLIESILSLCLSFPPQRHSVGGCSYASIE